MNSRRRGCRACGLSVAGHGRPGAVVQYTTRRDTGDRWFAHKVSEWRWMLFTPTFRRIECSCMQSKVKPGENAAGCVAGCICVAKPIYLNMFLPVARCRHITWEPALIKPRH